MDEIHQKLSHPRGNGTQPSVLFSLILKSAIVKGISMRGGFLC